MGNMVSLSDDNLKYTGNGKKLTSNVGTSTDANSKYVGGGGSGSAALASNKASSNPANIADNNSTYLK